MRGHRVGEPGAQRGHRGGRREEREQLEDDDERVGHGHEGHQEQHRGSGDAGRRDRHPRPWDPRGPAVRHPSAEDRPGDPARDGQPREVGERLTLGEPELVAVEGGHPRGDRGHREQDRRDPDEGVAHRRDPQDRPDIGGEPAGHDHEEVPEPVGEQRFAGLGGQLHPTDVAHVRAVRRAALGLGEPPAEVGDGEARDERDDERKAPPVAAEERAEGRADGEADPQPHVRHALLDRERPSSLLGSVVVPGQTRPRRVGDRLAESERRAAGRATARRRRSGTRPPIAEITDHTQIVTAITRVRRQWSPRYPAGSVTIPFTKMNAENRRASSFVLIPNPTGGGSFSCVWTPRTMYWSTLSTIAANPRTHIGQRPTTTLRALPVPRSLTPPTRGERDVAAVAVRSRRAPQEPQRPVEVGAEDGEHLGHARLAGGRQPVGPGTADHRRARRQGRRPAGRPNPAGSPRRRVPRRGPPPRRAPRPVPASWPAPRRAGAPRGWTRPPRRPRGRPRAWRRRPTAPPSPGSARATARGSRRSPPSEAGRGPTRARPGRRSPESGRSRGFRRSRSERGTRRAPRRRASAWWVMTLGANRSVVRASIRRGMDTPWWRSRSRLPAIWVSTVSTSVVNPAAFARSSRSSPPRPPPQHVQLEPGAARSIRVGADGAAACLVGRCHLGHRLARHRAQREDRPRACRGVCAGCVAPGVHPAGEADRAQQDRHRHGVSEDGGGERRARSALGHRHSGREPHRFDGGAVGADGAFGFGGAVDVVEDDPGDPPPREPAGIGNGLDPGGDPLCSDFHCPPPATKTDSTERLGYCAGYLRKHPAQKSAFGRLGAPMDEVVAAPTGRVPSDAAVRGNRGAVDTARSVGNRVRANDAQSEAAIGAADGSTD